MGSTPRRSKLVQIVITRKDAKTFQITTFDKKECRGGPSLEADRALKFIERKLKRLGKVKVLE